MTKTATHATFDHVFWPAEYNGTAKNQVNLTQVSEQMPHPVVVVVSEVLKPALEIVAVERGHVMNVGSLAVQERVFLPVELAGLVGLNVAEFAPLPPIVGVAPQVEVVAFIELGPDSIEKSLF